MISYTSSTWEANISLHAHRIQLLPSATPPIEISLLMRPLSLERENVKVHLPLHMLRTHFNHSRETVLKNNCWFNVPRNSVVN